MNPADPPLNRGPLDIPALIAVRCVIREFGGAGAERPKRLPER